MSIEEYFGDWARIIDIREADRILRKLSVTKQMVCPRIKDIFKAFTLCSLPSLKVVILGQDPYFDLNEKTPKATGIAFGNSIGTSQENYSPSLEILRESVIDFSYPHGNITFDPSLEEWEAQGVLLLNSALSCFAGKPGSHYLMWRPFITSFLSSLSNSTSGIVYVLFGSVAQGYAPCINKKYNHIIKVKHPSWYARNKCQMPSDLWYSINKILEGIYGYGIEWYKEDKFLDRQENEKVLYEEY